jgi:hypothetical protein
MISSASYIDAINRLAPQIETSAEDFDQARRLPSQLVEAMADAGLFRLWIPKSLGGTEADPMSLVRAVEEVSRLDGATGWCLAIGGEYGVFGGYLGREAAREIYGTDPHVYTSGALRAFALRIDLKRSGEKAPSEELHHPLGVRIGKLVGGFREHPPASNRAISGRARTKNSYIWSAEHIGDDASDQ